MRYLVTLLFVLLASGTATAQEFERLYSKSIQPVLSQPLQWVSAPSIAAPSLPEAFVVNPDAWAFAPYSSKTVLPTSIGRDVWLKFTLAATPTPQSWVIRIPRLTVRKSQPARHECQWFLASSVGWRFDCSQGLESQYAHPQF